MTATPASPLALVCHDAGPLALLLPWLDLTRVRVRACLRGPALQHWRERMGDKLLVQDLEAALDGAVMLLSGAGIGPDARDLEHRARLAAAALGLHSVAVLDHWIDYAARFTRQGASRLPDELWVADAEAYALARATFPGLPVRLRPNLHLQAQVQRLAPAPDAQRHPAVLLLPEPIGMAWGGRLPGEEQALNYLIAHAHRLGLQAPLQLRLRPHDHDPPGRWNAWLNAHRGEHELAIDVAPTLAEAIDAVAWVAGLESPALVLAHAAGRRAVCLQPPWAPRSRLPQRGLLHLRDLADRTDRARLRDAGTAAP
ncbi:MAG: hypothetical protein ABS84_01705 [Rubrivivax sp. SCN 71-131]|jgi:hypothetical protein|nr:MAG: hypothetical protein ABS84_01705 [Rubrivivax sp. SCN 71-131]